jgi:hypothetical protein
VNLQQGEQKPMANGKKTDQDKINAAERRQKALDLRKGGASYRAIAKTTDVSVAQAWDDVNGGLLELADQEQEKVKVLRQLEVERLDSLLLAHWTKAMKGDVFSSGIILRISDRRAKLLGLDKPAQLDITGTVNTGPNWNALQGVMMAALAAFPEARAAVAQALMELNPIEGEVVEEGSPDA